jgi:hypothetical protein
VCSSDLNYGPENDADIYAGLYNAARQNGSSQYKTFKGHNGDIRSIAFIPGKNEFFTSGSDGKVLKWSLDGPDRIFQVVYSGSDLIDALAVSPDAGWLACGSENSSIKMIPLKGTDKSFEMNGHNGKIKSLIFSYDNKHLYDIKTCKVWKKVFDPDLVEWHQQLNMYAWMLRNRGLDIKSINVIAIYMDWQQQRAFRDDSYPNAPIIEYELKLWQDDYTEKYINGRIKLMVESETLTDEQLPFCSSEEMWQRASETTFAVMPKKEATRASKVFTTMEEAKEYARGKFASVPEAFIEVRRPERTRCEHWCDGKDWCSQYKDYSVNKERILKEIVPI